MAARKLPADVISLIHHVKLNEAGWWRKAINQIVLAIFWGEREPMSSRDVTNMLRTQVGIVVSESEVEELASRLVTQNRLVRSASGFRLTDAARRELDGVHLNATSEQQACKDAFLVLCEDRVPGLDPLKVWNAFSKALAHAVSVAGANLYHLLSDGRLLREVNWAELLLSKFDSEYREGIRSVLGEFLSGTNEICRAVILRHLTAHFFAEASQLSNATIESIERGRSRRQIKVVLDTNFIFSVLDLHDNPGDDSAVSLLNLVQSGAAKLQVKLYVLPGTLEEAQRTLILQQRFVERVRAVPNVARAALSQPLPSIARKFFDVAAQAGGVTAQDYFQPYIDGLPAVLRDKGIHVLDASPQVYNKRQDVIDDTLDEQTRENAEVPEAKRKGYDKLLHDVVLWHAVNDRRGVVVGGPFDVEYWGVTIDWSLIGFDRRKRRAGVSSLPVVLHPSNLLQLIQFWVPRTSELEDGLIGALRLPLLFQSFDPQDERATIQVLEAISRFENVDDIPETTLRGILANRALRSRLSEATQSSDEIFELVREQLISEHKEIVDRLALTSGSLSNATQQLAETSAEAERANRELRELQAARARDAALWQQQADEHGRQDALLRQQVERLHRTHFVFCFVVVPLVLGVLGAISVILWADLPFGSRWLFASATSVLPLAIASALSPKFTSARPDLMEWWLCRAFSWAGRKLVLLPLGLAGAAIFQGFVWDATRAALDLGERRASSQSEVIRGPDEPEEH